MAKKLFALEDAGLDGEVTELEAAPEVGEVADAETEVIADTAEIAEIDNNITEGTAAADQLEEVQDLVEQAGDGEGLDPVAAEAIRIAVEAISSRIGANPKAVYSLYATENFASASSRKANTKIALEGIGEFLKNLWDKIKAALSSLWEKVVAFWNKHASALGRTLKAIDSMKTKVSSLKGAPSFDVITAPASLRSVFPVKSGTLGIDEIAQFFKRLDNASDSMEDFIVLNEAMDATTLSTFISSLSSITNKETIVSFGEENEPMPGGGYFKWTYKFEKEVDDTVNIYTLDVDEDHGTYQDGRTDTQLDIGNKDELKNLLQGITKITKKMIRYRDRVAQRAKTISNNLKSISKEIDATTGTGEKQTLKSSMRCYQLLMSKGPTMESKLLSLALVCVKGSLQYVSVCAKNYKS